MALWCDSFFFSETSGSQTKRRSCYLTLFTSLRQAFSLSRPSLLKIRSLDVFYNSRWLRTYNDYFSTRSLRIYWALGKTATVEFPCLG